MLDSQVSEPGLGSGWGGCGPQHWAQVLATVEEHVWTEKTDVFKRKRRTGYRRWKDHRQDVTHLRIVDIVFDPPADPTAAAGAAS